jgi:hypothetical protein
MMMHIGMMQALSRHVERVLMHRAKIRSGENGNLRGRCDKGTAAPRSKSKITESPHFRNAILEFVERLAAEF